MKQIFLRSSFQGQLLTNKLLGPSVVNESGDRKTQHGLFHQVKTGKIEEYLRLITQSYQSKKHEVGSYFSPQADKVDRFWTLFISKKGMQVSPCISVEICEIVSKYLIKQGPFRQGSKRNFWTFSQVLPVQKLSTLRYMISRPLRVQSVKQLPNRSPIPL